MHGNLFSFPHETQFRGPTLEDVASFACAKVGPRNLLRRRIAEA